IGQNSARIACRNQRNRGREVSRGKKNWGTHDRARRIRPGLEVKSSSFEVREMTWTQVYDPFGHWWLSTLVAALPIIVLFTLLAGMRVRPHLSALGGAVTAVLAAIFVFHMPTSLAGMSFIYGVGFGILKIAWIVLAAVYL